MKSAMFTFLVLLVVIPSVLNKAIPQESADSSNASKSTTEGDIDIETTTVIPDLPGGDASPPSSSTEDTSSSSVTEDTSSSSSSSSSPEETFSSTRKPSRKKPPLVPHHFDADYDMFLDHLNRTSQVKLEIFDRTLMEVEKELRPGTPLMKVVDWILNLFMQLQNNNGRQKPNNGQAAH